VFGLLLCNPEGKTLRVFGLLLYFGLPLAEFFFCPSKLPKKKNKQTNYPNKNKNKINCLQECCQARPNISSTVKQMKQLTFLHHQELQQLEPPNSPYTKNGT
jgi:hypothetical protein